MQNGFYVDLDDQSRICLHRRLNLVVAADLQLAAQTIEMLLIKDHTRMKHETVAAYDGTHAQQFRLLRISHLEDWAGASDQFRRGPLFPDTLAND